MVDVTQSYRAVLDALQVERAQHTARIEVIDAAIRGLQAVIQDRQVELRPAPVVESNQARDVVVDLLRDSKPKSQIPNPKPAVPYRAQVCVGARGAPCPTQAMVERRGARGPIRCDDCQVVEKQKRTADSRAGKPETGDTNQGEKPAAESKPLRAKDNVQLTLPQGMHAEWAEAAGKEARRRSHQLGIWRATSDKANSEFIAECKNCRAYITVHRDGKMFGPLLRNDCLYKG